MNFLKTPDDSTAVVRIMGEFNQFLTDPEVSGMADPRMRLTFEDDTTELKQSFVDRSAKSRQQSSQRPLRSLDRSQSSSVISGKDREKNVELIKNRSKIAHLESQLNTIESSRKRARVEHEKDCQGYTHEINKRSEDMEDLMKSVQYALDQEKFAKEQLSDIKKEFGSYKNKAEQKVQILQREKIKLTSEIEEIKEDTGRKHLDLRNALTRQEAEKIIIRNKLEECEAQLDSFKRRYNETAKQVIELDELRAETNTAMLRIKELEQQVSRQEDASCISKTMQSQLGRYRELERQNLKLEEDNRYYRETNESNLLLKEKMESLASKLKRSEQRVKDLTMMEVENEELRKRITQWEIEDSSGNKKTASPAQLTHEIAKLQQSQVVLLGKQSDLMSSSKIHEAAHGKAKSELSAVLKELDTLRESESKQKELCHRLQRRMFLITTERDGFRRILNVFDNNLSSNYNPQLRDRLQEAEERLTSYHQHIETVENEINQAKEKVAEEQLRARELERKLVEAQEQKSVQSMSTAADCSGDSQAEIKRLKEENMKLAEQLEMHGLRKEQMHMQGYYDPIKTKVIHFSMNPTSYARQKRAEEMETLRQENDSLRLQIKALEEGTSSPVDRSSTTTTKQGIAMASDGKEVQEVKAQLTSSELRNQRLKEVFSKKIQEFREACYALTGYKIDVLRDKQYRLQSMYAERSTDDLLFGSNSKGEMMLLETEFSSQVRDHIETFLRKMNSIPAFLSTVTLDLMSKQTTTIVIN